MFRTVNNENPFPYSEVSEAPYPKGNRIIGKNWYGLSHYLTADDDDSTSVTGMSANSAVEYIIDLTGDDIRNIRENTASKKSTTVDPYSDYLYVESSQIAYESGTTGRYKSSFIHEEFSGLFTKIPD